MKNPVKSRFHSFQEIPVIIAVAIALLVWVSGCKTVTSPGMNGSFVGRVILFDSSSEILTDFSGVVVSIDSTSFHALTDSAGEWSIPGVQEGQYDITASKTGFGAYHWYQQRLNGNEFILPTAAIARMSSFAPNLESIEWSGVNGTGWGGGSLGWGYTSYDYGHEEVAAYCDLDSTTQPSEPHLATSSNDVGYFTYNDLRAAGAHTGQTLYVSLSTVFVGTGQYIGFKDGSFGVTFNDPYHNNETRWASTGPKSNVIAVTMP